MWPEVEQELTTTSYDLAGIDLSQMKPWASERSALQARLLETSRQAQELDTSSAVKEPAEEAAQWDAFEASTDTPRAVSEQVSALRREYADLITRECGNVASKMLELRLNALDNPGAAQLHPLVFPHKTLGTAPLSPADYAVFDSISVNGWTLTIAVPKQDAPEAIAWQARLSALKAERSRRIREIMGK